MAAEGTITEECKVQLSNSTRKQPGNNEEATNKSVPGLERKGGLDQLPSGYKNRGQQVARSICLKKDRAIMRH